MKLASIAFLLGILLLQPFSRLPSLLILIVIGLLMALIFYFRKKIRHSCLLQALLFGFVWCLIYAHHQLNWTLSHGLEGKPLSIRGEIASIPICQFNACRFLLDLKTINQSMSVNHFIKLSWRYPSEPLRVGDEWQFEARLKRIHGSLNLGSFDEESYAFQNNIRAAGYVIPHSHALKLQSHWEIHPLDRFRQSLHEQLKTILPNSPTAPWLEALTLGERDHVNPADWDILRRTGTNHLMAIAGLHIGILSGFAYTLTSFLWRRIKNAPLILPAQEVGMIAALFMAFIYSALAGFSLPTQRALIMLSVFLIASLMRRQMVPWHNWCIALWVVLLLNPLEVLSTSFWLSFGSVALIIYGMSGRLSAHSLWWRWGRVQWVVAVGLMPLSMALFHQLSWVGFFANSLTIPLVGFLIVPLCLLGTVSLFITKSFSIFIFNFADHLLQWVWKILIYFAHFESGAVSGILPNPFLIMIACLGALMLLLPAGFPGRWLGIIWLLPLFWYHPSVPKIGEVWLTVLDVGQGLSAVLQTHDHLLVFDAGPRLNEQLDMGENVVAPFLYTLKTKTIDRLIISHGDNDHIGGANALIRDFNVKAIMSSVPEELLPHQAGYCFQGTSWVWDQVQFDILYPTNHDLGFNNDSSCVLRVTTGQNHILLTGDIEKYAEKKLLANVYSQLPAQILIAPHHGSKTSAHLDFIEAVNPSIVLYSTGYRNRFHLPNKSVIEKYTDRGVTQFNTAEEGAIGFKVSANSINALFLYRKNHAHYWNE